MTATTAVVGVWNIHAWLNMRNIIRMCAKYEISSFCFAKLKKVPPFSLIVWFVVI